MKITHLGAEPAPPAPAAPHRPGRHHRRVRHEHGRPYCQPPEIRLDDPKNDVFFVGFQTKGTPGRDILEGRTSQQ